MLPLCVWVGVRAWSQLFTATELWVRCELWYPLFLSRSFERVCFLPHWRDSRTALTPHLTARQSGAVAPAVSVSRSGRMPLAEFHHTRTHARISTLLRHAGPLQDEAGRSILYGLPPDVSIAQTSILLEACLQDLWSTPYCLSFQARLEDNVPPAATHQHRVEYTEFGNTFLGINYAVLHSQPCCLFVQPALQSRLLWRVFSCAVSFQQ